MLTMKKAILTFCVFLCLLALWFSWTALQPEPTTVAQSAPTTPKPRVLSPSQPNTQNAPEPRKKLHITSTGKVRLKPGESAVIGYWETVPGMNGMAIVTPETTPEGHVKMAVKLLQMPDEAVAYADAQDLFPDLFDFENYSAIDPQRLREVQSKLESTRSADMLAIPTVLTLPGQAASISIGNAGDAMLSLNLRADPIDSDSGYFLSMVLQRQE